VPLPGLERKLSEGSKFGTHTRILVISDDQMAVQFEVYLNSILQKAELIKQAGFEIQLASRMLAAAP